MKKLFVLTAATMTLIACGTTKSTEKSTEVVSSSAATSEVNSNSVVSSASSQASSASSVASSSAASSASSSAASSAASSASSAASSASSSTSTSTQAGTYTLQFKDTVGVGDASKVNGLVKNYINDNTEANLVSEVSNTSSQVAKIQDSVKGDFTVLQIGSSSKAGELKITFNKTLKSVTLNVENYNKNYVDGKTNQPGVSQDTSSKLYVNADANMIDLSTTTTAVVKEETFNINSNELKLYVKASKNRVFINSITFVF